MKDTLQYVMKQGKTYLICNTQNKWFRREEGKIQTKFEIFYLPFKNTKLCDGRNMEIVHSQQRLYEC